MTTKSFTVTVTRKNVSDRTVSVRITPKTLERLGHESSTEESYERAARTRAAEKLYGAGVRFQSDTVPHRGQVWAPAKGGGSNAVTDVITMRVD